MAAELEQYFANHDFVKRTVLQIEKDLSGLCDLRLDSSEIGSDPLKTLEVYLLNVLEELLNSPNQKLAQFIYKVDLPQEKFEQLLVVRDMQELAHEIIRREAQKVYLRKKFAN